MLNVEEQQFANAFTKDEIRQVQAALESGEMIMYLGDGEYSLKSTLGERIYTFFQSDMPYGTAKARTGDPEEWIANQIEYYNFEEMLREV